MRNDLESLLELSIIDKKVFDLKKSNKDLPIKINHLEGEINLAEKALTDLNNSIVEYEEKIVQNKDFTANEQVNLETSNTRLNSISTNKEYDAIHTEIATHKQNIEEAKANTTHYQQILENLKEDKKSVEDNRQTVVDANTPDLTKLKKELSSLESKIQTEFKKSDIPRKTISKKTLSMYDRLTTRRKTPYVIATINFGKKVCTICNRSQPPQKLIEIGKMDSLINCESCGSILIWKASEPVQEPVAK